MSLVSRSSTPSIRPTGQGLRLAFRRLTPLTFAVLPLGFLVYSAYLIVHVHSIGTDFHDELYPEAKLVLEGRNPFPAPNANLEAGGGNLIWPIPAALFVAPLTVLAPVPASIVFCVLLLVMMAAALRVLGVDDWRIYGLVLVFPATFTAVQTGNLTIPLTLLVAVMWRFRERRFLPGLALGLAIALKLFLWPLAVWLLARRKFASTAVAAAVTVAGTLLVLPFTTLSAYVQLMHNLGDTFGPHSYNLVGLLVRSGVASIGAASLVADVVGLLVLALAYRRRSLPVAIAASLLLSPIVWNHYFVLLVVPLAISRPRLSAAWAIPLALYLCTANITHVSVFEIVVALAVLAAVTVVAEATPLAAPCPDADASSGGDAMARVALPSAGA